MATETFNVNCDICQHKFEIGMKDIKSTNLAPGVEWRYFECPNCHMRFTTYVGDKVVERLIRFRNECRQKIKKELAKGSNLNQNVYHSIRIQDEHTATKIAGLVSQLKKEHNIEQREREFLSKELGESDSLE